MARRVGGALAALLALAVLVVPVALLAGQGPAVAAVTGADRASQSQASITISGMTPGWATPAATITVSGTVRNASGQPGSRLTVQLLGSSTPVSSVAQLELNASEPYSPATTTLPGAVWQSNGQVAPGTTADWSIRVPARALGMTTFGVYPLAAQAQGAFGAPLATTTTYLPYEPAKKGPYAASRPSAAKISWLWPLIDKPLLNQPWQDNCTGPQASALVQSIGSGRLSDLVRAGTLTQTTESLASAAAAADSRAAAEHAARAEAPQSLADYDSLTWVVDPALLANVEALASCGPTQPRWARAASAWLSDLRAVTAGRPLTVTPYGDPNVAALIASGHGADVRRSFELGRGLAGQILNRNLTPAATSGTAGTLMQAAGIAWPTAGVPGYGTLESLANVDGVGTLVLSSSAFPGQPGSVLKTADGGGSYVTALLASQTLTQLLGSSSGTSTFATAQAFLATTALLAQQVPSQPIVVAPPQRWAPQAGLAADLLADTATAPWLSPVSLTSLASGQHVQTVATQNWPAGTVGPMPVGGKAGQRELRTLDREIGQLQSIRVHQDQDLYLAVSAVESSAWQGQSKGVATAMLAALANHISREQQAVQIIAEKRITLGGLKGSVPVSIDNRLGYAVNVEMLLQYSQLSGVKITADPRGLVAVPPHTAETVRLRVQAAEVGSTTVTLQLASPSGQLLGTQQRMTIQATQVGVLGMIICAAALGVFLIAAAARAAHRGRPVTGTDQPGDDNPADDHDGAGGAERAEPDTVVAERAELGAAGKPGRD